MAVNGILLGQNTSSDTAPLIFDISDVNSSEGITNFFAMLKNQEKPNAMIWYPNATLLFHIITYVEDIYVEFATIEGDTNLAFLDFSAGDSTYNLSHYRYRDITKTVTLSSTQWVAGGNAYTQGVTVSGVSATETAQAIYITPAVASRTAYVKAGVYALQHQKDWITFEASKVPTTDLQVRIVIKQL